VLELGKSALQARVGRQQLHGLAATGTDDAGIAAREEQGHAQARKKISRNAPCPCGSGKKYKHCCYGKGVEDDLGLGSGRHQPQYPIGTLAMYGPDDKTTTKIAAAVILHDGAEAIMQRWVATDVTTNPKVQQELKDFFLQHGVKQVAMSQGNMGCPHEEGEDFPHGEDCPRGSPRNQCRSSVRLRPRTRLPVDCPHSPHRRDPLERSRRFAHLSLVPAPGRHG
jgi:SEC-C motif